MTLGRLPARVKRTGSQESAAGPGDDVVAFLARLAASLAVAGAPLDIANRPGKGVILMPGDHGRVVVDVAGAIVVFAPGATASQLVVSANATIYMASLTQSGLRSGAVVQVSAGNVVISGLTVWATSGPCVSIAAAARATINAAVLNQPSGAELVSVAAGGRAVFTGTVLGPSTSTATGAISNAGVPAAVDVTGVVRLVPGAHVNVTVVSEV